MKSPLLALSLSNIDRSTAGNDPQPPASFSALHPVVCPSPRHEGNGGQAPSPCFSPIVAIEYRKTIDLFSFPLGSRELPKSINWNILYGDPLHHS